MSDSLPSIAPLAPRSFLDPRRAIGRFTMSSVVGAALGLLVPAPTPILHGLIAWVAGASTLLAITWFGIAHADATRTQERCAVEDPGRSAIFALALASSLFSLFGALGVVRHVNEASLPHERLFTFLALAGVALSWTLTHSIFTLRYAHLHYRVEIAGGLQFPGDEAPDDFDFAYFAFTIGMCFQVSDVVIASSRIRREALIHALLSFVYNTVILALSLNLVYGMLL